MCRSGMCLATTAYILLVFSLVACALCFVAPFWVEYNDVNASSFFQQMGQKLGQILTEGGHPLKSAGLWGRCNADKKCFGFWENDYSWEKSRPDWHKAAQGLFAGGILFLLVAVSIATFHFCCRCCKGSFSIHSALGSMALAATICMAASLGVYAGVLAKDDELGSDKMVSLYWAFYIGIAGVVACLVSVILFFLDGCISRPHEGYRMTRVVQMAQNVQIVDEHCAARS